MKTNARTQFFIGLLLSIGLCWLFILLIAFQLAVKPPSVEMVALALCIKLALILEWAVDPAVTFNWISGVVTGAADAVLTVAGYWAAPWIVGLFADDKDFKSVGAWYLAAQIAIPIFVATIFAISLGQAFGTRNKGTQSEVQTAIPDPDRLPKS